MTEQIVPGVFRIEVPLPRNPLKTLNSYVIRSGDRSLIVDTGFNHPECLAAMQDGIREVGVDLARTDWFVTHMHADHIGQLGVLAAPGARVYFNRPEAEWLRTQQASFGAVFAYAQANGFPASEVDRMRTGHPGILLVAPYDAVRMVLLADGDALDVGEFHLQVIATPGHSQGHLCLYDADRKLLFSGDHVLRDITPNLQVFTDEWDALASYYASLDKVRSMAVDRVLPAHRSLFTDLKARVDELRHHHNVRCEEVLRILDAGPLHAYAVASQMTWDIRATSWDAFPLVQKWFAVGEALAHLRYLVGKGQAARRKPDGVALYCRA